MNKIQFSDTFMNPQIWLGFEQRGLAEFIRVYTILKKYFFLLLLETFWFIDKIHILFSSDLLSVQIYRKCPLSPYRNFNKNALDFFTIKYFKQNNMFYSLFKYFRILIWHNGSFAIEGRGTKNKWSKHYIPPPP